MTNPVPDPPSETPTSCHGCGDRVCVDGVVAPGTVVFCGACAPDEMYEVGDPRMDADESTEERLDR